MPSDVLSYQTIHLNSDYASGTSSNFRFALPGNLIDMPPKKRVKFGVLKATFVGAYTNVNVLNNSIEFTETEDATGDFAVLVTTIPVGTYTAATLLAALNVAMTAVSPSGFTLTYASTITNNIITFITTSVGYTITLNVDEDGFTAQQLLGQDPLASSYPDFAVGSNFVSPYTINLTNYFGPQEIHIRCSDLISRCYESRAGSVTSILAVCQNNVAIEDQNLTFSTPIPNILMETSYNVTSLTFQITNAKGEELVGFAGPVTMLLAVYHYDSD